MKKIYSVALAAAVALSASAAAPQLRQADFGKVSKSGIKIAGEKAEMTAPLPTANTMLKVKDGDVYTIDGDYEFTVGDYYFQESVGLTSINATITNNGDGTITLGGQGIPAEVTAQYNEEDGTITFSNYECGLVNLSFGSYYVKLELGLWDWELSDIVPVEAITAVFSSADGSIVFEGEDLNFGWVAYTDAAYTNAAGYLDLYDVISMQQLEPVDPIEPNGTFTDNILYPLFIAAENTPAEVQVISDGEGFYTVRGAFANLFAELGASTAGPDLVLDATDPDNVLIDMMSTGINGGADGVYYLFSASWYNQEYEEEALEDEFKIFMTEEENQVTVTFPYHSTYLLGSSSYMMYYGSPYVSTLTFNKGTTGVVGINVENAPVKYYNLQGVEVSQPEAGQIVICRQGNKVTKKIVK